MNSFPYRKVHIALCANHDLTQKIQKHFKSFRAFEIIFSATTEKQLLQQLAATPDYYHVLLMLDSTIALQANAQLPTKLMEQYPCNWKAQLHNNWKAAVHNN